MKKIGGDKMMKKVWEKPEIEILDVSLTMKGSGKGHHGGGEDEGHHGGGHDDGHDEGHHDGCDLGS